MLTRIIRFSLTHKLVILLLTLVMVGYGIYSLTQIPIGAVPDITNNQVQVITTSQNLSTQDMEQFITAPIELEMANLPGVVEIRSVSKFGLSVVTIVFEDDMGPYRPRQLIAEKIDAAAQSIPEGFGTPEMGPITTGLGEIYQYILDVKPGYEDRYSPTDLRTIQDWIVRRQLSGIPGVVEVNSWGGNLKQYEVAIKTEKLAAMDITAADVFTALEKNNSVAGGGYIEKENQAYFIRGEGLVSSLEDIENIVVKNRNGIPVYIGDIAEVGFGRATRYGAITGNAEGEKVLGQVMMLKDANSKKVIEAVQERVASISETLPEGIYINGFLDRSLLIDKTTFTITENLVLGFLIVIFVVVLLLGNIRSGLVVGSVIPLAMLFALSMMYTFGVDANLMSLGAIDFGIIIDGAVIIVEFIAFKINSKSDDFEGLQKQERQELKDKVTLTGASKMMNSAVFGQLIILIVFIPILSLTGVEGKMFRPMALTFSFALVGAMILCFTYVPVVSSIFLKPSKPSPKNWSVRLMKFLNNSYDASITRALKIKKVVLVLAVILLAASVYLYTTMGGEFVPTLDEGDFVIQPVLKTGTSLSKTIEITTEIERILIEKFPEVDQVVSRIGAAEVPTDPMSMEESDVIVTLKPKSEWVSANSKDELADKIKEALEVMPGMAVEFTQPIEMRFNELITGVRADIAIKIFGEDLGILSSKASQIEDLIRNVEGAADITVEKVEGLPQMAVNYNRSEIARYGLNVADINEVLSMAFGGKTVGSVFEGEKRFDMVVRLDEENRRDIDNLQNLYVDLPAGGKIPLSEVADVSYQKTAAKISRDETQRRIVVGINVRNRDLQSVVDDVQEIINNNLDLPPGYTVSYGGQFENLQKASNRLKYAVPVALILIFFMLYFAFNSIKETLIIYSAIPLAAVGGVWLLWLRDMPFSISAGVGFIALFGIAVLNGIVLIEHFNHLKDHGMEHGDELVRQGAKDRLRAVLLTASAAALGFLPMAVSTNAGAEVQRPLATVVIGGLVTATFLTLIVLPILYSIFGKSDKKTRKTKTGKKKKLLFILLLFSIPGVAQQKTLSYDELLSLALENNAGIKAAALQVDQAEALKGAAFSFNKTDIYYSRNNVESLANGEPLKMFGVDQSLDFPTFYFAQLKRYKESTKFERLNYEFARKALEQELALSYLEYQYAQEKRKTFYVIDTLYSNFSNAARRRFELGETNYLEKITAQARQRELELELKKAEAEVSFAYTNLMKLVQAEEELRIAQAPLEKLEITRMSVDQHVLKRLYEQRISLAKAENSVEKQRLLPEITFSYFRGLNEDINDHLSGYQAGLRIPILFSGNAARIKASRIATEIATEEALQNERLLETKYLQLMTQLEKHAEALSYYQQEGNELSEEILRTANLGYQNGEIDFFQYILSLENAYRIRLSYLDTLYAYNQTVIAVNQLMILEQ
ncbi:CusA/CzcA family heavy metal efflux RND transporter [Salinimicrobium sediminilitoris]|uniref:CusA/CzcA family heavy metal efflux RND transporter n=1 Tax=Salinimicrobium sediminilitoris TaxID=2876715 RepID=UPI001E5A1944|nr:CusA/CzcA family heavy metal efflux RND transporter [Salinimicrobium sediminilitoris]MCC8359641.1 CusA/CzcA family heavy metal efflux RND transporter [Salinimicrobium sediminilitoris]